MPRPWHAREPRQGHSFSFCGPIPPQAFPRAIRGWRAAYAQMRPSGLGDRGSEIGLAAIGICNQLLQQSVDALAPWTP